MSDVICVLLICHWFGDFICQSRWMASNKNSNLLALTYHVCTYSFVLFSGLLWPFYTFSNEIKGMNLLYFVGVNFVCHWATDFTSSKITKYFWSKEDFYGFFATVGFDQLIHQITLIYTARVFLL